MKWRFYFFLSVLANLLSYVPFLEFHWYWSQYFEKISDYYRFSLYYLEDKMTYKEYMDKIFKPNLFNKWSKEIAEALKEIQ